MNTIELFDLAQLSEATYGYFVDDYGVLFGLDWQV
jgi:hypothetical protein